MNKLSRPVCCLAIALLSVALFGTGCGRIDLPTWINIDQDTSSGRLVLGGSIISLKFSGGFYLVLQIDTTQALTQGVTGTIEIPVVRMTAVPPPFFQQILGKICMYNDPAVPLAGDLFFDLATGESEFALPLTVQAWSTSLGPSIGPFEFAFPTGGEGSPPLDFKVDGTVLLDALLFDGDMKNAIRIPIDVDSELTAPVLGEIGFQVSLNLLSDNVPSDLRTQSLADCLPILQAAQPKLPFHVPPRATFLRTNLDPDPRPPVIIDLAQLGAVPGDTLRFTRTGWFPAASNYTMSWGNAVFSASDTILSATGVLNRVPDAIDAGDDYYSEWVPFFPTDIPEDFGIYGDGADVVVPEGASHLFLGIRDVFYSDNTGLLFTVWIEKV